ncbi:MAG TPA: hypothetical protein EYH04_02155 [Archaeoglobus profundus]|nr:hypothetical protein [Archaeoglobus profundus]
MTFLASRDPATPIPAIMLGIPATTIIIPTGDKSNVTRNCSQILLKISRKPNSSRSITRNIEVASMSETRKNKVNDLTIHSLILNL